MRLNVATIAPNVLESAINAQEIINANERKGSHCRPIATSPSSQFAHCHGNGPATGKKQWHGVEQLWWISEGNRHVWLRVITTIAFRPAISWQSKDLGKTRLCIWLETFPSRVLIARKFELAGQKPIRSGSHAKLHVCGFGIFHGTLQCRQTRSATNLTVMRYGSRDPHRTTFHWNASVF